MPKKGEYSDAYSFHRSQIHFDCGGQEIKIAPHGTLSTLGIDKSSPKLYISKNEIVKEDINGAAPGRKPLYQGEPRNPLVPTYCWPIESGSGPIEEPKFLRDSMCVSDIYGATSKPAPIASSRAGATLNVRDINQGWREQQKTK